MFSFTETTILFEQPGKETISRPLHNCLFGKFCCPVRSRILTYPKYAAVLRAGTPKTLSKNPNYAEVLFHYYEVKAGSAIGKNDTRHLRWFKDNIARPFAAIILYSGEVIGSMGGGIWVVPFGALWE